MRSSASLTLALVLLIGGLLFFPANVAAQDPPAGLIVPDPAECDVAPRPISFFEQLVATPPAIPSNADQRFSRPEQTQRPWSLPAEEPADPATVEEVIAVLHEALACLNANDALRFLALFSDDMLQLFFAFDPIPPEAIPLLAASPVPMSPDQRLGYLSVHDVRILPDGRVAALADTYDPTEPPYGQGTDFAIFVKVGSEWRIDTLIENVEITGEGTPEAGTPMAQ